MESGSPTVRLLEPRALAGNVVELTDRCAHRHQRLDAVRPRVRLLMPSLHERAFLGSLSLDCFGDCLGRAKPIQAGSGSCGCG